jgi:hypothetical protein
MHLTCIKVVLPDPAIPMHRMVVGCFSLGAVIGSLDDMTCCCKEVSRLTLWLSKKCWKSHFRASDCHFGTVLGIFLRDQSRSYSVQ